jgi:hypothetical protein
MISLNGIEVTILDPSHLEAHREVLPLLPEAVSRIDIDPTRKDRYAATVDLSRVVGVSGVVKVSRRDQIVWGRRRPGSTWSSPFAPDRQPDPTPLVTIVFQGAQIVTAWIGDTAPREPEDPGADQESRAFWHQHAFAGEPPVF